MTDDADEMWDTFYRSLDWRPIAEFDRAESHVVLVRAGDEEEIGYWYDGAWCHAQESMDDQPLSFEPTEFAEVDDEWRVHLMSD